ncbi:hypothetical protein SLA2020_292090 [Shorea laevis]
MGMKMLKTTMNVTGLATWLTVVLMDSAFTCHQAFLGHGAITSSQTVLPFLVLATGRETKKLARTRIFITSETTFVAFFWWMGAGTSL